MVKLQKMVYSHGLQSVNDQNSIMISSRLGILDSPLKSPTSLNGSMSLVPSTVSSPNKIPFIGKQKEPPSGSRDESPSAG